MISKKDLIEVISGGWGLDLDENGNFQHNGIGTIMSSNKDPKYGKIENGVVWLLIPGKIDIDFNSYEELFDYKIDGISIYDRLKNENLQDICTRIHDDSQLYK